MTVLGETRIADFIRKHERSHKALARFLDIARAATWQHIPDLKTTLPTTDYDAETQTYIFDIGGNKYCLLAAIDFEEQILSVQSVMTHEQYNRR
jgi:mRNA interferase HigB